MKKKISIVLGICALIIVVIGIYTLQKQHVHPKHADKKVIVVKKADFKNNWLGVSNYPNKQKVTIAVKFKDRQNYELIETNTVSQCWKRVYTGTFAKKADKVTLNPTKVEVSTYNSEVDLDEDKVQNSETVQKSDFYRQFGNQQTGTVAIKQNHLLVVHDHEKVLLHRVK